MIDVFLLFILNALVLLVNLHVVDDVADFGCFKWTKQAAEDLVCAARGLINHELFCETKLSRISTVSIAWSPLTNGLSGPIATLRHSSVLMFVNSFERDWIFVGLGWRRNLL